MHCGPLKSCFGLNVICNYIFWIFAPKCSISWSVVSCFFLVIHLQEFFNLCQVLCHKRESLKKRWSLFLLLFTGGRKQSHALLTKETRILPDFRKRVLICFKLLCINAAGRRYETMLRRYVEQYTRFSWQRFLFVFCCISEWLFTFLKYFGGRFMFVLKRCNSSKGIQVCDVFLTMTFLCRFMMLPTLLSAPVYLTKSNWCPKNIDPHWSKYRVETITSCNYFQLLHLITSCIIGKNRIKQT